MSSNQGYESPGIAGSGAIATGLAAVSTTTADTILLARSEASAWRAEEKVVAACAKIEGAEPSRLRVTTDPNDLSDCDIVVEAIVEEVEPKGELIATVAEACPNADLATTTSSLSIGEIADAGGADRLFGLHVFNPVPRMKLVEVCFPDGAAAAREKALAWCAALGKTAVEVPDQAGFVVNRLLFPYLFEAVRLIERTGMEAGEVDTCMKLGAGHPMGPLALLDFVGLDVSEAIGDALYADNGEAGQPAAGADRRDGRRRQAGAKERRRLLPTTELVGSARSFVFPERSQITSASEMFWRRARISISSQGSSASGRSSQRARSRASIEPREPGRGVPRSATEPSGPRAACRSGEQPTLRYLQRSASRGLLGEIRPRDGRNR